MITEVMPATVGPPDLVLIDDINIIWFILRHAETMSSELEPALLNHLCEQIKASWDERKSVYQNLADMGLSTDPNKTIRIKTTMERLKPMDIDDVDMTESTENTQKKLLKEHVVKELEAEASQYVPSIITLSQPNVMFCTYMLDKYGDNYKAMSKDPKNCYQETPKQIKKKINIFKNSPVQYEAYLKSKGENI